MITNSIALATVTPPWGSVFCHSGAHIQNDECGAPEFFGNGLRLVPVAGANGKVTPAALEQAVRSNEGHGVHSYKPSALSLTQATEGGTVYSIDEIRALCDSAHAMGMKTHMDGARFANAVASLRVHPKELTWRSGVDVLTFGGTKNGMPMGEAVVFFDKRLAGEFDYRCKQAGQLASKMRYLSAPWLGLLKDGAMLRHAGHANACARELADAIAAIPGIKLVHPTEANAVFAQLPEDTITALRHKGWVFYTFIGSGHCRFMCSWATRQEDITALANDIQSIMHKKDT